MSILIKDMNIPKYCGECRFAYQDQDSEHNVDWVCAVTHKILFPHDCRDDCPLVPVPPHGDLIERKAVGLSDIEIAMCNGDYKEGMKMLLQKVENAPTIIEADESDMDSFIHIFEEDDEEDGMNSFIRILEE